jgi:hypothetical protein
MIGAGTFINPLLKVVTVVAILAAVSIFVVKPILDTTEEVSSGFNDSIGKSLQSTNNQIDRALDQAEQQTSQSFSYQVSGSPAHVKRVLHCIQKANNDVTRIQGCIK